MGFCPNRLDSFPLPLPPSLGQIPNFNRKSSLIAPLYSGVAFSSNFQSFAVLDYLTGNKTALDGTSTLLKKPSPLLTWSTVVSLIWSCLVFCLYPIPIPLLLSGSRNGGGAKGRLLQEVLSAMLPAPKVGRSGGHLPCLCRGNLAQGYLDLARLVTYFGFAAIRTELS